MTDITRHWHVVANTPGYLPEAEPFCLDGSEADAAQAVWDEVTRILDAFEEADATWLNATEPDLCITITDPGDRDDLGLVVEAIETERTEDCEPDYAAGCDAGLSPEERASETAIVAAATDAVHQMLAGGI